MAFIITGHHRSGTSILALLCNSHPEVTLTNEFGNFFAIDESFPAYARFVLKCWWKRRNVPFALSQQYPDRIKGLYMLQNLIFITRYLFAIRSKKQRNVNVSTIDVALTRIMPQARIVGDKHPDYVFKLDRLVKMEALQCLFIYRDPRDLAGSVVKLARTVWRSSFPEELREARHVAERWVAMIESVESHGDRIRMICYEDLVTNPKPVLQALGNWLDVDPTGFQHQILRTDSIGNYHSRLLDREIADIIEIAGPAMQRLRYRI